MHHRSENTLFRHAGSAGKFAKLGRNDGLGPDFFFLGARLDVDSWAADRDENRGKRGTTSRVRSEFAESRDVATC